MNKVPLASIVCLIALAVTSCSYTARTNINPATNVYSNYADKVPGNFALYVDAEEMSGSFKVQGFNCAAHSYPVDARNAFATSVERTFENLVEKVQSVPRPLDRETMQAQDLTGMIIVEVKDLDVTLSLIPGFWSAEMEADAEVTVGLTVDGPSGRMLGTSIEGDEDVKAPAGMACEGGATAIGKAVEEAMKEALERLGERLSNAPRLRSASLGNEGGLQAVSAN